MLADTEIYPRRLSRRNKIPNKCSDEFGLAIVEFFRSLRLLGRHK